MITREDFLKNRQGSSCEIAIRELYLYAENDGKLYKNSRYAIDKALSHRHKIGDYDFQKSIKAYKHFFDMADKKYRDDFNSSFSSCERWACAYDMAIHSHGEFNLGNYTE